MPRSTFRFVTTLFASLSAVLVYCFESYITQAFASITMCYKIERVRWCGHKNPIWRPGPRTCPRAIRENRHRSRRYPCSEFRHTTTRAINEPCRRMECRMEFKKVRGWICCQCEKRGQHGDICTGPDDAAARDEWDIPLSPAGTKSVEIVGREITIGSKFPPISFITIVPDKSI